MMRKMMAVALGSALFFSNVQNIGAVSREKSQRLLSKRGWLIGGGLTLALGGAAAALKAGGEFGFVKDRVSVPLLSHHPKSFIVPLIKRSLNPFPNPVIGLDEKILESELLRAFEGVKSEGSASRVSKAKMVVEFRVWEPTVWVGGEPGLTNSDFWISDNGHKIPPPELVHKIKFLRLYGRSWFKKNITSFSEGYHSEGYPLDRVPIAVSAAKVRILGRFGSGMPHSPVLQALSRVSVMVVGDGPYRWVRRQPLNSRILRAGVAATVVGTAMLLKAALGLTSAQQK